MKEIDKLKQHPIGSEVNILGVATRIKSIHQAPGGIRFTTLYNVDGELEVIELPVEFLSSNKLQTTATQKECEAGIDVYWPLNPGWAKNTVHIVEDNTLKTNNEAMLAESGTGDEFQCIHIDEAREMETILREVRVVLMDQLMEFNHKDISRALSRINEYLRK